MTSLIHYVIGTIKSTIRIGILNVSIGAINK